MESLLIPTRGARVWADFSTSISFFYFFYEITEEKYTAERLPTPLAPLFNSSLISGVMPTLYGNLLTLLSNAKVTKWNVWKIRDPSHCHQILQNVF